jgi:hypothetical protein
MLGSLLSNLSCHHSSLYSLDQINIPTHFGRCKFQYSFSPPPPQIAYLIYSPFLRFMFRWLCWYYSCNKYSVIYFLLTMLVLFMQQILGYLCFAGHAGTIYAIYSQLFMVRRPYWYCKNAVLWDVAQCASCKNRRFGGMLVLTRATRRNILEGGIRHSHHRENLKSYLLVLFMQHISFIKNGVFWDVTPCGSCKNWRFWGT